MPTLNQPSAEITLEPGKPSLAGSSFCRLPPVPSEKGSFAPESS
jgi:hypothetical protein